MMKTSELTGAALDLRVARALELEPIPGQPEGFFFWHDDTALHSGWFAPSTDWAHGGPIIDRERIAVVPWKTVDGTVVWTAYDSRSGANLEMLHGYFEVEAGIDNVSPTPLIAGMRAFVAGKYGESVPDN
jgi:hypothetical protein